jgi:hypothetical protein
MLCSLGVLRGFHRRDELLGFSQLLLLGRGQNSLPAEVEHHLLGVPKDIRLYTLRISDISTLYFCALFENRALKLSSRGVPCVEQ